MKKKDQILTYIKYYEITIAAGIVIVVVIFLSFQFLIPSLIHAKFIYQQKKFLQTKLQVVRQKDSTLSNLDSDAYKNALSQLGKILPETRDYVSFFTTFDELEKKHAVSISKTDFQLGLLSTQSGRLVKSPNSPAYVIPITMQVIGTTESLPAFFADLYSLEGRLITIDSIHWGIPTDTGELKADITGKAYYYPLPALLGNIDTPLVKLSKNQEDLLNQVISVKPADESQDFSNVEVGIKSLF